MISNGDGVEDSAIEGSIMIYDVSRGNSAHPSILVLIVMFRRYFSPSITKVSGSSKFASLTVIDSSTTAGAKETMALAIVMVESGD